jgi:uncharacterized protein YggU (UPF0235/DUF167 family)
VTDRDVRFAVRLTPRGGRDRIGGVGEDGALRAWVAAAPVEYAANRSLVRLVALELGVPPSAVRIVAGSTSRRKTVAVAGLGQAAILARWPGLGL